MLLVGLLPDQRSGYPGGDRRGTSTKITALCNSFSEHTEASLVIIRR